MKTQIASFCLCLLMVSAAWARPTSTDWQKLRTYQEPPKQATQLYQGVDSTAQLNQYQIVPPATQSFSLYRQVVTPDALFNGYRKTVNIDRTFIYYPSNHPSPLEGGIGPDW